jgi:hypothetical protein
MNGDRNKNVVFVLGPPRSGTSAISALLNRLGINFGSESHFVDASTIRHNPKFYELRWVNELNDEMFKAMGTTWTDLEFFTQTSFGAEIVQRHTDRIGECVTREWGSDGGTIGIKDPRISLLFPVWRAALSSMGYRVRCVICLRHPAGYALSESPLMPGWQTERLMLDWIRHLLSAVYFTREVETLIVNYDRLVSDPSGVWGVASWLGIPSADYPDLPNAIDPSHYHHSGACIQASNGFVDALYRSLQPEGTCGDVHEIDLTFYSEFLLMWPLLRPGYGNEAQTAVTDLNRILHSVRNSLATESALAAERLQIIRDMREQADQKEMSIRERDERIVRLSLLVDKLSGDLREREITINKITSSRGWRILAAYGRFKYRYLVPLFRAIRGPDA